MCHLLLGLAMINQTRNSKLNLALAVVVAYAAFAFLTPAESSAQDAYRVVPMTVYEKKPVTITRWVDETVSQKQTVTKYEPIWQTETRHRTQTTYKPIQETAERIEKITLRKPVVENLTRTVTRKETTYETMTKYRDEEYTVREPVMETRMRTEEYTVSKPVTKRMIEVKKTTTYKPVVGSETLLVPTEIPVIESGTRPDPTARARIQFLQPGYYTDPASGRTVYRKRGLHWVQPTISDRATVGSVPALVPQQYGKLAYVPETKEERKPIEITRYVDEVKTRMVPFEVEKMVSRTKTRRVPYEVEMPKTVVTTEEVPYTRTTYKEEVITKRIPYTRTRLQKVVTTEPYDVEVPRWISVTKEIEVPKTVARRVQKTYMQDIPKTVMMKIPVDICGNDIGPPQSFPSSVSALKPFKETATDPNVSIGVGSTLDKPAPSGNFEPEVGSSIITRRVTPTTETQGYRGKLIDDGTFVERAPKTLEESSKSILKVDSGFDETPKAKTEFKEILPNETIDLSPRRPRTSELRSEDPFGEYNLGDSSTYSTKTLVETSKRDEVTDFEPEVVEPEIETNYAEMLESPSKPSGDVEPSLTGNEKAADPQLKK